MSKIKAYIKGTFYKIRKSIINKCREMVYNYEFEEVLNHKIEESFVYYENSVMPDLRVGVLCPAMVVAKMIEKHFGFEKSLMMRIHAIDVDTQSADAITATIKLNRPGLFIGKGGSSINSLEAELTKYFNKKTDIRIVEVKKDVNLPLYIYDF